MLVCVPTCSEADGSCPEVLSIDYSVSCDAAEFQRGRVVALTTLTILGFAIPVWAGPGRTVALHRRSPWARWLSLVASCISNCHTGNCHTRCGCSSRRGARSSCATPRLTYVWSTWPPGVARPGKLQP
jgi:hypothetical protein